MSSDSTNPIKEAISRELPEATISVEGSAARGFEIRIASRASRAEIGTLREKVLKVVDDETIKRLEFTFADEATAPEPATEGVPNRIDWHDAIALGHSPAITVNLPSIEFVNFDTPVVATFYSLRGGVGRSTGLVQTAYQLVANGLSVLCLDMDLEAPGLSSLFGVEDQVREGFGVVSLLSSIDLNETVPDLAPHIIPVSNDGRLQLLPAGIPSAQYAQELAFLDPAAWYSEEFNPLRALMNAIREFDESLRPDVILIDSRTGMSPIAAPLVFDVADIAIIAFYPHPQARRGTELLTRSLLAASTERGDRIGRRLTPEPRFVASPVPNAPELRALYSERAQEWISEWLSPARTPEGKPAFEAIDEILQVVGYQESVASRDSLNGDGISPDFEPVASWIAGFVTTPSSDSAAGRGSGPAKPEILASLEFTGQTADEQPLELLKETFVGTAAVTRALDDQIPLVIGRKGTGKTFIFRYLATRHDSIVITSPTAAETHEAWMPTPEAFQAIAESLEALGLEWTQGWYAIIGLSLLRQGIGGDPPVESLKAVSKPSYRGSDLVADCRALLSLPDAGLVLREWLQDLDVEVSEKQVLLFDGLDTGFGGARRLRNNAVAGLMSLVNDLGPQLDRIRFKVLVREDIWTEVSFPNKSHLRARSAFLKWGDQNDYLRIAIRQALRSVPFKELVAKQLEPSQGFDLENTSIEFWPDSFIRRAWQLLAGERVAGGRTAYTDNWVWARLADGNGDHAPRNLIQLLHEATQREMQFEQSGSYVRSIIRPRALVESLDEVSERALDALRKEEFAELEPLLVELEGKPTPFSSSELEAVSSDLVELAIEVGLLESVTPTPRDVSERYRVPEIYRKALGMSRKGQA